MEILHIIASLITGPRGLRYRYRQLLAAMFCPWILPQKTHRQLEMKKEWKRIIRETKKLTKKMSGRWHELAEKYPPPQSWFDEEINPDICVWSSDKEISYE